MLQSHAPHPTLRERLLESERLMRETGCYDGITELTLRRRDPLKFETLHTKLRAFCVSAREMARRISASPGVREVGEMVVAIYTPEGDAIALSNGIMVHVHTMSRFIKWMIRQGYEDNPGIRDGDIFANNDAFIGTVQVPDVMDVVPIFYEGELAGWAGAVCHELELGGITPGGDVCLAQERFTEGLFVCAEKIGENDEIRRDYVIRCERNLRMPIYWVLDEKAKVASCIDMRENVKALIGEVGLDYWMRVSKEFIEEGRRGQLLRTRQLTVPGRYRGHTFYGHVTEGKPGFQPLAEPNWLYNIPLDMEISTDGKITVDFEGTQPWGYHSMNCTPAGMDGGMFVTLTQHMNFEGLVNDGAWMATELKLPKGTWTNPDNEMCATATSWALLLPAFGVFQRLLSRGFLARGFRRGGVRRPGQQPDDRDGRRKPIRHTLRHGAFRMRSRGLRRARHQGRTGYCLCRLEPGIRHGKHRNLGAEHADDLSRPFNRCQLRRCGKVSRGLLLRLDVAHQQDIAPEAGHLGTFLAGVRQRRHVRRLSGPDLPEASCRCAAPISGTGEEAEAAGARAGNGSRTCPIWKG